MVIAKKDKKSTLITKRKRKAKVSKKISKKAVEAGSKTTKPKSIVKSKKIVSAKEISKYIEAIGRRKTSRARVRLWTKGEKVILVNNKPYKDYFRSFELQQIIISPLALMKMVDKFRIVVRVSGGGIHSQAEAVRHGIARVLVEFNSAFRKRLKRAGFLTRDSRMRERKKFGLKRARRAPQWQKR